jgi:hypothetical protein
MNDAKTRHAPASDRPTSSEARVNVREYFSHPYDLTLRSPYAQQARKKEGLMNPKLRSWCGVLFVVCLAVAVTWHFDSVFGQQAGGGGGGGRGGGAGIGVGGAGGAGGAGAGQSGGRGGAGGVAGSITTGASPGAVSASGEFVYVVHNDTLYQFAAQDLSLVNHVALVPAPQKTGASTRR